MAKRRKKGSRRRYSRKKKSAPKKDRAMPLGAGAGGLMTGIEVLAMKTDSGFYGPIPRLLTFVTEPSVPAATKFDLLGVALKDNLTDTQRYYPLLIGAAVSAAPKIPLVKMLAKPMDKAIRRVSKGKVSL